ncbi:hypothetical protein [Streptomyces sp. NPDC048057]|uniref:hypothetical protein n=1 Tax=Streptomyces sp. NPDC048057 TaxID=3155628 RepID=UPI0033D806F9
MPTNGGMRIGAPRARRSGAVVTVFCVLVGWLLTALGEPRAASVLELDPGLVWLASDPPGLFTSVDPSSARPVAHVPFPEGALGSGGRVEMHQGDDRAVAQLVPGREQGRPGSAVVLDNRLLATDPRVLRLPLRVSVAASGTNVFTLDSVSGRVAVGESPRVPRAEDFALGGRIGAVVEDGAGGLWAHLPTTGEARRVGRSGVDGTVRVSQPGHDVRLVGGGGGTAAAVDTKAGTYAVLTGGDRGGPVSLPLAAGERVAAVGPGARGRLHVVAEPTNTLVTVDTATGRAAARLRLPDEEGGQFGDPVEHGGRIWVPDRGTGRILAYGPGTGRGGEAARLADGPAPGLTAFARGEWIWANDPGGPLAMVGDAREVRVLRKYPKERPAPSASPSASPSSTPSASPSASPSPAPKPTAEPTPSRTPKPSASGAFAPVLTGTLAAPAGRLSFAPDGRAIAVHTPARDRIDVWVRRGTGYARSGSVPLFGASESFGMEFTPDWRSLFLAVANGDVGVYDMTNPRAPRVRHHWPTFFVPSGAVTHTAVDAAGSLMAMATTDRSARGELTVLDFSDPDSPRRIDTGAAVGGPGVLLAKPVFSPAAPLLAVPVMNMGREPSLVLVDLTEPQAARTHTTSLRTSVVPDFTADGRWMVASGTNGALSVWDVSNPSAPKERPVPGATTAGAVAISPDGRLVAAGPAPQQRGPVTMWRRTTDGGFRKLGTVPGGDEAVRTVAFGEGGRVLALGTDKDVRLWRMR